MDFDDNDSAMHLSHDDNDVDDVLSLVGGSDGIGVAAQYFNLSPVSNDISISAKLALIFIKPK